MKEIAQHVFEYLGGSPLITLGFALVAGFAGSKTASYEWRSGVILWLFVGTLGLFLSQFVLLFLGFQEYLDRLPEFRILLDLIAAYIGAFLIAALIHFVRPL
jgi:uncharacterized membrane protein YeaQ/YmgE (transglycosylase-associated protein family)